MSNRAFYVSYRSIIGLFLAHLLRALLETSKLRVLAGQPEDGYDSFNFNVFDLSAA